MTIASMRKRGIKNIFICNKKNIKIVQEFWASCCSNWFLTTGICKDESKVI